MLRGIRQRSKATISPSIANAPDVRDGWIAVTFSRESPPTPLILAEARTQVYGRCTQFKGCFEAFETRDDAFRRERQMKVWRRVWKIELIEKTNPGWRTCTQEFAERQTSPTVSAPAVNLGPRFREDERKMGEA